MCYLTNPQKELKKKKDQLFLPQKNFGNIFGFFPAGSDSKESARNVGDPSSTPGLGDPLEKGMVTHSSILA